MNFSLAELLNSIQNNWKKLTSPQKIVVVLAPLIVATALFTLIFWASRPQYVSLMTKLDVNEAAAVTEKLKELKVNYKLADGGSTVLVPQKDVSEIRLQLANAGLPKESSFSFENLDQMRIGETDKDRRLRFILGLQNELEKTIETLDGVEYARVHIVMPEHSLFLEEQKDTTAAVTIKRTFGSEMSEDQVSSIANLLAYSVEGLTTDKVTIVDTNGNTLSDVLGSSSPHRLTATQIQIQQTMESNIQQSVQSMLDKVFGIGKTVVRANAAIDFDQRTITSQRSEDGALTSRQEITESSTSQSGAGGVPGEESNIPEGEEGYQLDDPSLNSSSSESRSITENYQPSVIQEETVVSPGQIKRLTVSVLADADSVTEEQLDSIEGIVASAIGINQDRGDLIQVARLPFNKTSMLEDQAAMEEIAHKAKITLYAQIAAGIVAGIILLVLLLKFRSRKKYNLNSLDVQDGQKLVTLQEAEEILAAQLEAEREAELKLARKRVKSSDEIEKEKTRKEVDKYSRENPDEVARLVKTWLAEE